MTIWGNWQGMGSVIPAFLAKDSDGMSPLRQSFPPTSEEGLIKQMALKLNPFDSYYTYAIQIYLMSCTLVLPTVSAYP